MKNFKKLFALILILALSASLYSCSGENVVLDEIVTHEVSGEIRSLDISVSASSFVIKQDDTFSVESNLMYLNVTVEDGVLKIKDEAKPNSRYDGAKLTLGIPSGASFDIVSIMTGAANLESVGITTKALTLALGAGSVRFDSLTVEEGAAIGGGAGSIEIGGGRIKNLALEMGVGELHLNSELTGSSNLVLGLGEAKISLLGGESSYKIDYERGIGSFEIDGEEITANEGSYGSGGSLVTLIGGLGELTVLFD